MAIRVPGNVYLNGYLATRELLRCVEEAGTTNNIAVIKKLEGRKMPARERLHSLIDTLEPFAERLGAAPALAYARGLVERNGALRQRAVARESGPRGVAEWLVRRFADGV